jgi:hypothetical protein
LTSAQAQEEIRRREQKRAENETKAQQWLVKKEAKRIRDKLQAIGLISRDLERSRKRALKRLARGDISTGYLLILVPDPEQLAKEAEHFEAIQGDFLPFDDSSSSSKESDDSVTFFLGN